MPDSQGSVRIIFSSDVSSLVDGVGRAIDATRKFADGMTRVGQNLTSIGTKMTLAGAAITGPLGVAVKTATDFESAFTGVRKTVDATEAEFQDLEQRFRDLSKTTPITFTELSRIGELAGQLGVRGVDDLESFTKTIADISVTTDLTAEAAATSFARIANILQVPISEVGNMASAVVGLGNNFATTESSIVLFAQRIAGAGQIAGLATSDIFSISTALSSVGVEAEAGGTAVQKVLLDMNTAVAEGSDKVELFAQVAGMSAQQFADAWRADPGQAFTAFVNGLAQQGDSATTVLNELEFADVRLQRAFLSLAGAGDLLNRALAKGREEIQSTSALTEEANKRYETAASRFQMLRNQVADLASRIGEALLPVLLDLVAKATPLIEWATQFIQQNPALVLAVSAIGSAFTILGPILVGVGITLTTLAGAFSALLSPVGLVTAAIGTALAAAFVALRFAFEPVMDAISEMWPKVVDTIQQHVEKARTVITGFVDDLRDKVEPVITAVMEEVRDTFKRNLETATEIVTTWVDTGRELFRAYIGALENVALLVGVFFASVKKSLGLAADSAKEAGGRAATEVETMADRMRTAFDKAVIALNDFSKRINVLITGIADDTEESNNRVRESWEEFKNFFKPVTDAVAAALRPFGGLFESTFNLIRRVGEGFRQFWQDNSDEIIEITQLMAELVRNGLTNLITNISTILTPFLAFFQGLFGSLTAGFEEFDGSAENSANGVILAVKGILEFLVLATEKMTGFVQFLNKTVTVLSSVFEFVGGLVGAVLGSAIEGIGNFINFVGRALAFFVSSVTDTGNLIHNGIQFWKATWSDFVEFVVDVVQRIWDALKRLNPWHRESPSLVDNVRTGVESIRQAWQDFRDAFSFIINPITSLIDRVRLTMSTLSSGVQTALSNIQNYWHGFLNWFSGIAERAWAWMQRFNPFHRQSPSLVDNVKAGTEAIRKLWDEAAKSIQRTANSVDLSNLVKLPPVGGDMDAGATVPTKLPSSSESGVAPTGGEIGAPGAIQSVLEAVPKVQEATSQLKAVFADFTNAVSANLGQLTTGFTNFVGVTIGKLDELLGHQENGLAQLSTVLQAQAQQEADNQNQRLEQFRAFATALIQEMAALQEQRTASVASPESVAEDTAAVEQLVANRVELGLSEEELTAALTEQSARRDEARSAERTSARTNFTSILEQMRAHNLGVQNAGLEGIAFQENNRGQLDSILQQVRSYYGATAQTVQQTSQQSMEATQAAGTSAQEDYGKVGQASQAASKDVAASSDSTIEAITGLAAQAGTKLDELAQEWLGLGDDVEGATAKAAEKTKAFGDLTVEQANAMKDVLKLLGIAAQEEVGEKVPTSYQASHARALAEVQKFIQTNEGLKAQFFSLSETGRQKLAGELVAHFGSFGRDSTGTLSGVTFASQDFQAKVTTALSAVASSSEENLAKVRNAYGQLPSDTQMATAQVLTEIQKAIQGSDDLKQAFFGASQEMRKEFAEKLVVSMAETSGAINFRSEEMRENLKKILLSTRQSPSFLDVWFQDMGTFQGSFATLVESAGAAAGQLKMIWFDFANYFQGIAMNIYNAMQRLNPFARFSPSLVDEVEKGTDIMRQFYEDMANDMLDRFLKNHSELIEQLGRIPNVGDLVTQLVTDESGEVDRERTRLTDLGEELGLNNVIDIIGDLSQIEERFLQAEGADPAELDQGSLLSFMQILAEMMRREAEQQEDMPGTGTPEEDLPAPPSPDLPPVPPPAPPTEEERRANEGRLSALNAETLATLDLEAVIRLVIGIIEERFGISLEEMAGQLEHTANDTMPALSGMVRSTGDGMAQMLKMLEEAAGPVFATLEGFAREFPEDLDAVQSAVSGFQLSAAPVLSGAALTRPRAEDDLLSGEDDAGNIFIQIENVPDRDTIEALVTEISTRVARSSRRR